MEMRNYIFPDVSHHKGAVDHQKFADIGARLVIAKASDTYHMPDKNDDYDFAADRHTDAWFVENFVKARAAGLIAGSYHFGRVTAYGIKTIDIPQKNLDHYLIALKSLPEDIQNSVDLSALGILDMEQSSEQLIAAGLTRAAVSEIVWDMVQAWVEMFNRVIFYSGSWWTDQWLTEAVSAKIAEITAVWEPEYVSKFADENGLITNANGYGVNEEGKDYLPSLPKGFNQVWISTSNEWDWDGNIFAHQYGLGKIPGVAKTIDMNRCDLNKTDLEIIFGQSTSVDPPAVDTDDDIPSDQVIAGLSMIADGLATIGNESIELIDIIAAITDGYIPVPEESEDDQQEEIDTAEIDADTPEWMSWWYLPMSEWPSEIDGLPVAYVEPNDESGVYIWADEDEIWESLTIRDYSNHGNTASKRLRVKKPVAVYTKGDTWNGAVDEDVRPFNLGGNFLCYLVMHEQVIDGVRVWNRVASDDRLYIPQDKVTIIKK